MRPLYFLCLFLLPLRSMALAENPGILHDRFEEVITTALTREELEQRVRTWFSGPLVQGAWTDTEFLNTEVLQRNGIAYLEPVAGQGWAISQAVLRFQLQVQLQNGRCSIRFGNLSIHANVTHGGTSYNRDVAFGELKNDIASKRMRTAVTELLQGITTSLQQLIAS
jgi:hypothetical protein